MSTKMGFWRWALASAVIVIAAVSAQARVVDPTGVTTTDPAAILNYPKLKVDLNTCNVDGTCSLTPSVTCADDGDCQPLCNVAPGGDCAAGPGGGCCNLDHSIVCNPLSPDPETECPAAAMDTVVQLTNTSEFLAAVHCFYSNANGHCSNSPTTICNASGPDGGNFPNLCPPGGICVPGWQETDFHLTLTKRQPISWSVNDGLAELPLADIPGQEGQMNEGSIPPIAEAPFTGDLVCVEVDTGSGQPVLRNDFKGEATTVRTIGQRMDVAEYNAIGFKAILDAAQPTDVLNIGGPDAQYGIFDDNVGRFAGCPNVITMNHFFDGADVVSHNNAVEGSVDSTLTLVPCARDYLNQTTQAITIQFLVYNEFEQRFSTSTKMDCYKEVQLSDIDTRPGAGGNSFSIFSAGVEGTITGFTRIRSVAGAGDYDGRTILPLLTENWASGSCDNAPTDEVILCTSDADCPDGGTCENPGFSTDNANVQWQGSRPKGDRILLPPGS